MRLKWNVLLSAVIIVLLLPMLLAEKTRITVEWIYSEAGNELTKLPRFRWLDDGRLLLFEVTPPEDERTFEVFDPRTKVRSGFVNGGKALSSIRALLPDEEIDGLTWPVAFDGNGKRAVFLFRDDIFLLDLQKARFDRITQTEAEEKAVQFSPDGRLLSFVRENDLFIHDVESQKEVQLSSGGSETLLNGTLSWVYWEEIFGRHDIGYWWSDDSKALAYLESDEEPVSVVHFLDYEPEVPRLIKQRYPKAGGENPLVRVGIRELGDSGTSWIQLPRYEYIARVNWLPGSRTLSVQTLNRSQDELNLYFVDRGSKRVRHVLKETDEGWVNIHDDLLFLENSSEFLWQSERDGYAHLYRYSGVGKLRNQVTKGNWALRSSGGVFWMRQSLHGVDEENGWAYFTSLEKAPTERHLYRIRLDGSEMTRLTRDDGVHTVSFSNDAKFYVDTFSAPRLPPSLSVYDTDGTLVSVLSESRTDLLEEMDFQFPELFTIPTSDGFQMPAEILKPADFDPGRQYPVIFHVYGGPSAPTVFSNWNTARYFDQILLEEGYLVVRFDHPAATAISKKLENRLVRKMSGPIELKDIVEGVRWLKAKPFVDEERFGIWGWSGGGSFTLNSMTNSAEFKAGIAVAPVTDWHYYDTKWAEFAMKLPDENPEGYEETSFVRSAKNLHGRLLLVHGTYDDNVHPQNSWAFIEELVQANIQFEMMFYPMRKHGIRDNEARIHLYTKMLEFWKRNLKGDPVVVN
jgi:dipeptidyl-peptidase-4